MNSLKDVWSAKAAALDDVLDKVLPPASSRPKILHESMRYSSMKGGKRFRGFLVCCCAELFGGNPEAALLTGAAIEMIHAYSLIHDDLPCMDNDDFRHGKPSNHKAYGEAVALLAGDALLTHTFAILCDLMFYGIPPVKVVNIIKEIADAIDTNGMIGGQVEDMMAEGEKISGDDLYFIHKNKTGALIISSARAGAMLGEPFSGDLDALTDYAGSIGLAFQITDDILNEIGDPETTGKPVRNDKKRAKATYISLFGLEKSILSAKSEVQKAHRSLECFGGKAELLHQLADYILTRTK
ncbi:MAG: polyprenyl synthetase family protein [Bacillota bacterium]